MRKIIDEKTIQYLLLVIIGILLLLIAITNLLHFTYNMNADIAAEALLGREVAISNSIIPASWYSSTEVRILGNTLLAGIVYKFTGNMNLSMGISCILMTLLILVTFSWFMRALSMERTARLVGEVLILGLANSLEMLGITYLFAGYYAVHIAVLFFTLGIYAKLLRNGVDADRRERNSRPPLKFSWFRCVFVFSLVLSFVLGMQGARALLVIYGPLFAMEVLRFVARLLSVKKNSGRGHHKAITRSFPYVFLLVFINVIGMKMPVSVGQETSRNLRNGWNKLISVVVPDALLAAGITWKSTGIIGKLLLSALLIFSISFLIVTLVRTVRIRNCSIPSWIYMVLWAGPIFSMLAVAFTTTESTPRYYFGLLFVMAFGVALLVQSNRTIVKQEIILFAVVTTVVNAIQVYRPILLQDDSKEEPLVKIAAFLSENNYPIGYASFEYAEPISVYSNGEIQVAPVASVSTMNVCKWLSSKNWYVPNRSADEITAYIIEEDELEDFAQLQEAHPDALVETASFGSFHIFVSDQNYSNLDD